MSIENLAFDYYRQHFGYWPDEDLEYESEEYQVFKTVIGMVNNALNSEDMYSVIRKEEILTKILSTFHVDK